MKKLILFAAFLAIATITTFAQKGHNGKLTPNSQKDRVANMARLMSDAGFSLSEKQETQLRDVFATEQVKMQGLRNTHGMEKDVMREKMKTIRQNTQEKVNSILSAEQIQVMKDMRKARSNRGHKAMDREQGKIEGTGGYKPIKDAPQTGGVKPPKGKGKKGANAYMKLSETLETAGLPLNKDQGIQIKALFDQQRAQLKDLHSANPDNAAFKLEAKKVRKATHKQVRNILDKTQRKALKAARDSAKS